MNSAVRSLCLMPNGDIIAGGYFTVAGGVSANYIARWNGSAWSSLGSGMGGSFFNDVKAYAVMPNGDLIVGGRFLLAGGVPVNNIARWDGANWSPLGAGVNDFVRALLLRPDGTLVAGGNFTMASGSPANAIAVWDGSVWSTLGTGFSGGFLSTWVQALTLMPNGDLIAGGFYTTAGTSSAQSIARWNGTDWSPLGASVAGVVNAVDVLPGGDLVAGGTFTTAGVVPASRIARWRDPNWSALGAGTDAQVNAFAVTRAGRLIAAGNFSMAGGKTSVSLATYESDCPATTVSYGSGCAGSGGLNALAATAHAWTGGTFRANATGMPLFAFVLAITGFSQVSVPLALVLPQGVPGCNLLVSPDFIEVLLPAAGTVTTQLALPNSPSLAGLQFNQQVVPMEVDLGLALLALTSSNALAATIGIF
jgi:hypothetical protein